MVVVPFSSLSLLPLATRSFYVVPTALPVGSGNVRQRCCYWTIRWRANSAYFICR